MSIQKTEKGLVYKLSQKCLDQEEEIQNLLHNVARMQEVLEKKQTKINKLKAELNYKKAVDKYKDNLNVANAERVNNFAKIFHEELIKELKTN
jgi:uncharacterized coiled-coil protein SlyX